MTFSGTRDNHDDYWKIDLYNGTAKEMRAWLEDRHYQVGAFKEKDRLDQCILRSKLGRISYYKHTNAELRNLIAIRKIDTSAPSMQHYRGNTKEKLLALLDYEDEHPKFERFLQLPPELRNKVYAYHYADFRDRIYAPSQPPLSRICRQLRRESLPMFYATCEFELRLQRFSPSYRYSNPRPATFRLTVGDRMLLFLHSTDPKHLAAIRRLHISASWKCPGKVWSLYRVCIGHGGEYTVEADGALASAALVAAARSVTKGVERRMTAAVEMVAAKIAARPVEDKVVKDDFFELRRAIEVGLK
ncbi:hypothetical protein B0A55_07762 [Friedmanniomyces simplex]|uniref:Uncharacterized protein n=1 Tax=Friedmanniomyces simplex TaxID=329884 RepID=A0A4U0X1W9_9PEZI|nr:hypothetical protein B0A55_07762 [Friedmanniomyces simplex]